ncbi:MAG: beta galactosidase jelly roll domain-containing protein [Niabella sp.]
MQIFFIKEWWTGCIAVAFLAGWWFPAKGQTIARQKIDLQGEWQLKTDPSGTGMEKRWMDSTLTETVTLPGTMAQWKKGIKQEQPTTSHLNVLWQYTGAAWYQRRVQIPASWADKDIHLSLERTKVTSVWVDGRLIGKSSLLSAPQSFKLPEGLKPGWHTITICVNNDPRLVSVGGSHAISDHTQTNWNGIIGAIYLEAVNRQCFRDIRVQTDVEKRRLRVRLSLANPGALSGNEKVRITLAPVKNAASGSSRSRLFSIPGRHKDSVVTIEYTLDKDIRFWSEYEPALYKLSASLLKGAAIQDNITITTGFRDFQPEGTRFRINNTVTFLRGKNESCVFPLTGYPPTNVSEWRRVYSIARQYGINHYRFHSYTPPKAAFEAADLEGIYIQAELPNWSNFSVKDTVFERFQLEEGKAIIDAYGNHPSFVMLTLGNELAGEEVVHNRLIDILKRYDGGRRLYAFGTNAFYDDPHPGRNDDFWVTMRTGGETADGQFDVRGSFATTEDKGNGILNAQYPNTSKNFIRAIANRELPVVSHETGQYQVYPDYSELSKYTGILKPLNLEIFRERLQKAGMGYQADSFFKASGRLAVQLYRREIEMAMGTPGLAGFQLLDLQDFPGQGTALVGILNAFMESKGLIDPETFRQSCNDLTLQLLMDRYVWTNTGQFRAVIRVVNYSPEHVVGRNLIWKITDNNKQVIGKGGRRIAAGQDAFIHTAGEIVFPFSAIKKAAQLTVSIAIEGTAYKNEYPVWVYPSSVSVETPASVLIANGLTEAVWERLSSGGKVLLFPSHESVGNRSVGGQFITEFWNWKVFKEGAERQKKPVSAGTLGILTDPGHPLFEHFPTEFYSSWQWWPVVKNARPLILDSLPPDYRPLVQVIDNIDRNHKLGLIFECSVGQGKLLVCMSRLDQLKEDPAARQLYYSILQYMGSDRFRPVTAFSPQQLKEIL